MAAAKVAPAVRQAAAPAEEEHKDDDHEDEDEHEDDDGDNAPAAASGGDFDYDRFLDETVGSTPRGIVMSMDISGAGEELSIGSMGMEMRFSTEPVVATDITIRIAAGDTESELQIRTVDEVFSADEFDRDEWVPAGEAGPEDLMGAFFGVILATGDLGGESPAIPHRPPTGPRPVDIPRGRPAGRALA